MRDFDWKIISTLHATKNITKTANLLFITQPSLTKRIQIIEEELQITLITRSTKGVSFTPEGELIAKRAERILNMIDEVHQLIAEMNGGRTGTIHIGAPNSLVRYLLPEIIENFTIDFPQIKLEITTDLSSELLKQLENHELHASFVRGDIATRLEKLFISEEQIYIVSNTPIAIEDLPKLRQIDYSKEPTIIKATDKWWRQHFTASPDIWMKVNNGQTCLEMIRHNLGYGIFSDHNFFKDEHLYSIPMTFKDGSKLTRKTWLVYDRENLNNTILRHFVDFVKDKYAV
ncbi:LysR family transcriptional regulator [Clostridium sp. AM58-1XD]|uniref:LysR family transcriptional regulator n=1 Tax=Clostridium sp. AM58-1XD TaxID=2292307 RepID=UPI000E49B5CE|nr:LysR family transcriptional regulator [Clostridium sp. AM58-1XD]RGY99077.1 LysR family transcriptional regulator [Clostridium sp. AM58-1XD]